MAKFTFKRDAAVTGPARGASLGRGADIKLGGKLVGRIREPHWSDRSIQWSIFLRVAIAEHPGWRNATLKARFNTFDEAKNFLIENCDALQSKLELVPEVD